MSSQLAYEAFTAVAIMDRTLRTTWEMPPPDEDPAKTAEKEPEAPIGG